MSDQSESELGQGSKDPRNVFPSIEEKTGGAAREEVGNGRAATHRCGED